jgi:hypothetical protein
LSRLLDILAHDIVPVFVVIGLGYVFARRARPDVQTLSRVAFYIFSPSLVFISLVSSELAGDEIGRIAAFTVVASLIMGGLGWGIARLFRLSPGASIALILSCMFVNAGNYGLGVNQQAFGDEGLARATVFFTTSAVLVYTLGVSIAAGQGSNGWRGTVRRIFEVPPVYAVIAALAVRALNIDVTQPALEPLWSGLEIAGRAMIPCMLIVLGVQLAQTELANHLRPALAASGLRLLGAPVVAWGLAGLMGLTGVARQASIVEASMPAAVNIVILATEFKTAPGLVTSTVVLSTVLSPFTLAVIIALLKCQLIIPGLPCS